MFSFISSFTTKFKGLVLLSLISLIFACSPAVEKSNAKADSQVLIQQEMQTETESQTSPDTLSTMPVLEVHKDPNCGCCQKWIDHLEQSGFQSKVINSQNVNNLKKDKGIAPQYRSCHTAISNDGYIFEGHVPAKFIKQFLLEHHDNAIGLSVPAMPIGTPGMEMGDKFMPYHILLLKADGSNEVYAAINSYQEQF